MPVVSTTGGKRKARALPGFAKQLSLPLAFAFLLVAFGSVPANADGTGTVRIEAAADVNGSRPVPVDLVSVSPEQLRRLQALSAEEWFAHRAELLARIGSDVHVAAYEFVPGQVGVYDLPHVFADGSVLVFARYAGPGPHRLAFDPAEPVGILLGADDLDLVYGHPQGTP